MSDSNKDFSRELDKKKVKMLSVVAFGCNKKAEGDLRKIFRKHKYGRFFFYEYFAVHPICKTKDGKGPKNGLSEAFVAPFLERVLRTADFVPDLSLIKTSDQIPTDHKKIKYVPMSRGAMRMFWDKPNTMDKLEHAKGGSQVYRWWARLRKSKSHPNAAKNPYRQQGRLLKKVKYKDREVPFFAEGWHLIEYIEQQYLQDLMDEPWYNNEDEKEEEKREKLAFLKDFLVTAKPWIPTKNDEDDKLNVIYAPIASDNVFWGYLILYHKDCENGSEKDSLKKDVKEALCKIIKQLYCPVLALFENYWEEYIIEKGLKKEEGKKEKEKNKENWTITGWQNGEITIQRSIDKQETTVPLVFCKIKANDSLDTLEKTLGGIWGPRKDWWGNRKKEKKNEKKLREHLVFSKYNIASPTMLKLVAKIACLKLKKTGKALPSALVIGGPGSGKDALTKLIAIFSKDYTKGNIITINMASYKPQLISTPLLAGLDIHKWQVGGLFSKLIGEKGEKATLILDELNSLDIDAQGTLLRILEDGKVVHLGAIEPVVSENGSNDELDILIIGAMNEDPERLTKESTLRQIMAPGGLFGGALGEVVYEHIRNIRRLREDLYYRLIRGGKFEVPGLNKRREDIPILFYIHVQEFAKSHFEEIKEIDIDFEAYDVLMLETLDWPGNVRQLQAIAKRVVDKKFVDQKGNDRGIEITAEDVEEVLRNKDIGMLQPEEKDEE